MNLAILIPLVLKASIFLNVFCLGLDASPRDATYLFHNPGRLARSLASMYIVMPLLATVLALAFDLYPPVKIALVSLAVAPVPPMLPRRAMKAGGHSSYTIGLLMAAAVLAIVIIPLAVALIGRVFHTGAQTPPSMIFRLVLLTVIAPLSAGIAVHHLAPGFARRMAKPLALTAMWLLVAGSLPILFIAWPAFKSLTGNGTIAAMAAFVLAGLAAGHLLGGPDSEDRTVLALSTAARHPGIAIAIAGANHPEQKLVPAAILLYLILSALMTIPYTVRRKRGASGITKAPAA